MNIHPSLRRQFTTQNLLRNTVAALLVGMVPTIALASSWSPTLLVNTEAFQTIDKGDGSSNIELRFGDTGSGLQLNVNTGNFEFDSGLNVNGDVTASGGLVIEGESTFNDDATFGSGIVLNGVKYIFPFGDASASGKLLSSDGNGNLSWTAAGSTPNVFQTISVSGQSDVVSDQESDTLTFVAGTNVTITTNAGSDQITISATDTSQQTTFTLSGDSGDDQTISHGNTLEIAGGDEISTSGSATDTLTINITDDTVDFTELEDTLDLDADTTLNFASNAFNFNVGSGEFNIIGTASGTELHAEDRLTSSGTLAVEGDGFINGDVSLGDESGDTLTINAQTLNWANPVSGTDNSVLVLNSSNNIVADEIDSRVWGSSLVDGSGNANRLARWSDSNTLEDGGISDSSDELAITIDSNEKVGIGTGTPEAELDVVGTISGSQLQISGAAAIDGALTLGSLTSCTNLETDASGVLSCNNTDYITELELDTEAELEAQLTDVTNVLTNNDSTDDLTEGSNLYFTDERVDDRISALFKAGSGIVLNYDDTNNTFTVNQGTNSGSQVSLSPEFAGAVYYGDGANNVGQMVLAYDSSNKENYYKWTSTQSSLQDYNIAVRVKVPDDFSHWDGTAPIQFRYRTNASSSADNQMDVTMLDTAGSAVSLTGGADLANQSWTTATITGPESSGTYTPGSYITIIIAMQARTTNSGEAHAGFLNINWSTRPH